MLYPRTWRAALAIASLLILPSLNATAQTVSNFTFEQLNFLDPNQVMVVPNSDWGQVSFTIAPVNDGLVRYLNISAQIGPCTGWIVRNYPILPYSLIDTGRFSLHFDLNLLCVPSGINATSLDYVAQVGSFQMYGPTGMMTTAPITALNVYRFGLNRALPSGPYLGPGALEPPYLTDTVELNQVEKYKDVPGVQEEFGECGAGSFARSLKWLADKNGWNLGTVDQIQRALAKAAYMDQGVSPEGFVQAKKDYISHNNIPLEVHCWDSTTQDLVDWFSQEMKKGQDIEVGIWWGDKGHGHIITLVGVDEKNKTIEYRDDEWQGYPRDGDEGYKDAKLVARGARKYGFEGVNNPITFACAESPTGLGVTPLKVDPPESTKPSVQKTYPVILTSYSSSPITIISVTDIEDSTKPAGPSGWIGHSGAPATIPPLGSAGMQLQLNRSGIVTSGPTVLFGKLRIVYGPPTDTMILPIQFTVADTIALAVRDTISTNCVDLIVGSDGNMGKDYFGRVNMDYAGNVTECDTGRNSRGDAEIYLGDGSPIIIRKLSPVSYRGSWSAFTNGFETPNGFKPMTGFGYAPHGAFSTLSYDGYNSGTFVTVDSLVKVEKTWWAPKHPDSCNFVVQRMRVFPASIGSPVTNLQIGEIIDFDVPSDSGSSANVSGFDLSRDLVWQRGFNSADAITDCANNSTRYAGLALLNWFMKNKTCFDSVYSAGTIPNDIYVNPGIVVDSLSRLMHTGSFFTEIRVTDVTTLFAVKDGATGYTLPANDTLTIFYALATVQSAATTNAGLDSLKVAIDKAKNFMRKTIGVCASCCTGVTGNVNMSGIVDLADLSALVSYLTGGGYVLPCQQEANVNNSGIVDLADLSALVSYLTGGGYVLPACP